MGGMGAAAALRAPTPASGAGSLPRASSLAARRVFGAAPRPGRVRRLGSRARACTRVRASGGGLFGALPSAADATRFASEVKSTELELSRGMWRAFDAGVASASDALARAGEASTSGVSVAATRAADAAARFLPSPSARASRTPPTPRSRRSPPRSSTPRGTSRSTPRSSRSSSSPRSGGDRSSPPLPPPAPPREAWTSGPRSPRRRARTSPRSSASTTRRRFRSTSSGAR